MFWCLSPLVGKHFVIWKLNSGAFNKSFSRGVPTVKGVIQPLLFPYKEYTHTTYLLTEREYLFFNDIFFS